MYSTTINMHISYLQIRILESIKLDQHYLQVKKSLHQANLQHKNKDSRLEENGIILYKNKLYVLNSQELIKLVLK